MTILYSQWDRWASYDVIKHCYMKIAWKVMNDESALIKTDLPRVIVK